MINYFPPRNCTQFLAIQRPTLQPTQKIKSPAILTCNVLSRRSRGVRNLGRSSAASSRRRSSAPRIRRRQSRGRRCRGPSILVDTGRPAGPPCRSARLASRPCSSTCPRRRPRDRRSSGPDSPLLSINQAPSARARGMLVAASD